VGVLRVSAFSRTLLQDVENREGVKISKKILEYFIVGNAFFYLGGSINGDKYRRIFKKTT
jgi:hypothetical protein